MGASRTKVRGSQTIRHCRSMCGSNFSGLVACFFGFCQWQWHVLKMDLLVTMHLMMCVLRWTTIPKCQAPWTRKTAMKAMRTLGAVRTPARHRRQHGWTCPQLQRWCPGDLRQCARREGLEVRLSREWVRAFLVSIDLSYKSAAQRRGLSTSVPRPNRCCKRSFGRILTALRCGVDAPIQGNELTDTLHRIWQSFPRCLGAT